MTTVTVPHKGKNKIKAIIQDHDYRMPTITITNSKGMELSGELVYVKFTKDFKIQCKMLVDEFNNSPLEVFVSEFLIPNLECMHALSGTHQNGCRQTILDAPLHMAQNFGQNLELHSYKFTAVNPDVITISGPTYWCLKKTETKYFFESK